MPLDDPTRLSPDTGGSLTREDKAWMLTIIVLGGFVIATMFHYVVGAYFARPYPANTFLFDPRWTASDFFDLYHPIRAGTPYGNGNVYLPFAVLPLWLTRFIKPRAECGLMYLLLVSTSVWWIRDSAIALRRPQTVVVVGVIALLNYPLLYALDRGNLEIFTFVLLCAGLWQFRQARLWTACALFAGAAATKGYPGVFVVLFLVRREYRMAAAMTAGAIGLNLVSAAMYPGGISQTFASLQANLRMFATGFVDQGVNVGINTSYFGLLQWCRQHLGVAASVDATRLMMIYVTLCLALFAALGLMLWRLRPPLWKQVAILAFSMILLPQVSFDYKLLHLLLPVGLYLRDSARAHDRRDGVLLGSLLIPKSYLWLLLPINGGVIFNPLLMTILSALILVDAASASPGSVHPSPAT